MNILIIGGMGLIGGAIAEASVKAGYDVTILSRRSPFGKWRNERASFIQGNWYDDALAGEIVSKGFDVIVDTLIFDENQMKRSANIVNGHCKQFVYISTDSVYVHPGTNVSEDNDIAINDLKWDYGMGKRKAELYLLSHSSEYDFKWTVIRPTITFGETRIPVGFSSKRGTYTLIDRIEKGKPIIRFDDKGSRHSICHASVFGNASACLFLNENAYGRLFHISDDISYTFDEIFEALETIVGRKCIFEYADARMLKKYDRDIYEDMIFDKDSAFTLDNSNIKEACPGIRFHTDLKTVLKETVDNLQSCKKEGMDDAGYDMLSDLLILKNRKEIKDQSAVGEVSNYLDGLSADYIRKLKRYGFERIINQSERKIKKTLVCIKKLIVK